MRHIMEDKKDNFKTMFDTESGMYLQAFGRIWDRHRCGSARIRCSKFVCELRTNK